MNMGHLRGMERVRYYSRFRHAKFEVTAPNLSTTKAKQLRGLSLCLPPHWSEVRAHCRNTMMPTSAMIVVHHGTNVRVEAAIYMNTPHARRWGGQSLQPLLLTINDRIAPDKEGCTLYSLRS